MKRQANAATIALIKESERCRLTSYLCPAGKWTVGWGSTRLVGPSMRITQAQAEERFADDLAEAVRGLELVVPKWLNDNQFGALVDFVFNFGISALVGSRLLRLLRDDKLDQERRAELAAAQLPRWIHALDPETKKFVVLPGLVTRRAAARKLFETPVDVGTV